MPFLGISTLVMLCRKIQRGLDPISLDMEYPQNPLLSEMIDVCIRPFQHHVAALMGRAGRAGQQSQPTTQQTRRPPSEKDIRSGLALYADGAGIMQ